MFNWPIQVKWLKGYIYSSCYYHHQIGSIHLIYCFHIFPWLCAWDVCYIIFCHLLYTPVHKEWDLFFKCIFYLSITNILKQAFNMTFIIVIWGWCEIWHAYDYSSHLYDHSKSVRLKKRDIKTLAMGTDFGGYFIIPDGLLWELKLFIFNGVDMKLVHKITVCVSGLENKFTLS